MEATTTRASTVIKSMPTSETRTQASMTMPLSNTRSRTSTRLVPPAALSTGMVYSSNESNWSQQSRASFGPACPARARRTLWRTGRRWTGRRRCDAQLAFERFDPLFELMPLDGPGPSRRQVPVVHPPVESDFARLVEGADDQPDPDRQQLHFGKRNLDVA